MRTANHGLNAQSIQNLAGAVQLVPRYGVGFTPIMSDDPMGGYMQYSALNTCENARVSSRALEFEDADLATASFSGVDLTRATFTDANMSNVLFNDVFFGNAKVSNSNLIGIKINGKLVSDLFVAYDAR